MTLWMRVALGVTGYFALLYMMAMLSAIVTTEARCLEMRVPEYRVTYDFQRYCIAPADPRARQMVMILEALEGVQQAQRTQ